MNSNFKNQCLFALFSLMIGAFAGIIIWSFFRVMNFTIDFLWIIIPSHFQIPFYTILVCTIGGLIIGIVRKKLGDYPEDLEVVMEKVKKEGRYSYKNIPSMLLCALLPLTFGGSVGPEAGLTGVIAGLCTWIGDKFKKLGKEFQELTKMGISATLGTIFNSPMFGFVEPIESSEQNTILPKTSKIVVYFLAILGAMGIFIFLKNIFGGSSGLSHFSEISIQSKEWFFLIPFSFIGIGAGFLYHVFRKFTFQIAKSSKKYILLSSLFSGLTLGIIGTLLPYTMFSGEHQMSELMEQWTKIGALILLLTGIVKLLLTNICINFGFKGGHFFPVIFSGVCIGFSFAILTGVDPIFAVTTITTSLVSCIMKKPLATVLLLMICFPTNALFVMLISSILGSMIPLPKYLQEIKE